MGITRYKKTVACDCACNHGMNCGDSMTFLFCYNRSVDIGTLHIKRDRKDREGTYEFIAGMTDNQISALIEVLTSQDPLEELTDVERKMI